MAKDSKFLAFDFGAESGRALLGILKDNKLELKEIHRFPNIPITILGHMHWNILQLFQEIKQGLRLALKETDGKIDGIGVDTWGVDFGLLGEDGELLAIPMHNRDNRTDGIPEELFKIVPWKDVFEYTGIQFMQLNTLFQLYSMVRSNSTALKNASTLLLMPDIFNYWLTGEKVSEFSIASTTQIYDPRRGEWAFEMLEKLGIPTKMLPKIVSPGTKIGTLHESLVKELGGGQGIPVFAPACHDTASAVAAVPATGHDYIYLSSGTWSLMGVEIPKPNISEKAFECNFTNEGGVAGTIRFLKNIVGLWIVQECRRTWLNAGENVSYAEITYMARESEGFVSIIDPDSPRFLAPGDMPQRIKDFCAETKQPIPETKGAIIRCVLDSLALRYRATVESLDDIFNKRHDPIHILGGGTQNTLLSQLTADVTGRTVIAGPIEATSTGNVLVQAIGAGYVDSIDEAREIVRNSFDVVTYRPNHSAAIDRAYSYFKQLST